MLYILSHDYGSWSDIFYEELMPVYYRLLLQKNKNDTTGYKK